MHIVLESVQLAVRRMLSGILDIRCMTWTEYPARLMHVLLWYNTIVLSALLSAWLLWSHCILIVKALRSAAYLLW